MKTKELEKAAVLFLTTFGVSTFVGGGITQASESVHTFECRSMEDPLVKVAGRFDRKERMGIAAIYTEVNKGLEVFPNVEFEQSMASSDGLDMHIRDAQGGIRLGLRVDGFFSPGFGSKASLFGELQTELLCKSSCDECLLQNKPNEFCKKECGCSSLFCGGW